MGRDPSQEPGDAFKRSVTLPSAVMGAGSWAEAMNGVDRSTGTRPGENQVAVNGPDPDVDR